MRDRAEEPRATTSTEADGVSVLFPVTALLRYLHYVVGLGVAFALLAGLQALFTPRTYEVSASFVTERTDAGSGATAGRILGQLGVSLTNPDSESPRFFADLLTSREIMVEALHAPAASANGDSLSSNLIFHELGGQDITAPNEIREGIRTLRSMIETEVSNTGIVSYRVQSTSPTVAENVAVTLMELVNRFNAERRQSRAQQERTFVEERAGEQEILLRQAEAELQQFLRQNRAFQNSPELLFEHDRLQRKVGMRQQLVTGLLESSERARIEEVRNLPILTQIDAPHGAAEPRPRYTILRTLAGGLFGSLLGWLVAVIRLSWIRLREGNDPAVADLQSALEGIRSGTNWSRRH